MKTKSHSERLIVNNFDSKELNPIDLKKQRFSSLRLGSRLAQLSRRRFMFLN